MRQPLPYDKITSAYAGTIVYPPKGTYGPRMQHDVQLVLLHSGELDIHIDGIPHAVKPGQAVLLKPRHNEYFVFAKHQESWHRWITLSTGTLTEQELAYLDGLPFRMPIPESLNAITDLMLSVRGEFSWTDDPVRSLGYAALNLFAASGSSHAKKQQEHPSVLAALGYIRQHYANDVSLQTMAAHAGVTPEHLVRLFHAGQHPTPIRYLWQYRVVKATELLTLSGLTVGEIASRCGFKSAFHLSRLVKEQTGSTPTELRKSAWGAEH
ncbi:helix-turn-helix transcriptional regulator [Paenibacillus rhizovicinus]|uniref:Helix-turn-helix transcriptional regulator n=1 Tax=Paenibacillus rhizovicinus TaxID=2704463 RepID=A0A6C0NY08_9BACL|nr:AraC family transcriptional regulator [Paenibacillus rhizovicinus]QHW31088.1 helix-turn-helix transcriptional regulator [Paenibacillus rhizovicinus]